MSCLRPLSRKVHFLELKPDLMAQQMTLLDSEVFQKVEVSFGHQMLLLLAVNGVNVSELLINVVNVCCCLYVCVVRCSVNIYLFIRVTKKIIMLVVDVHLSWVDFRYQKCFFGLRSRMKKSRLL